jgi:hypothetical protein
MLSQVASRGGGTPLAPLDRIRGGGRPQQRRRQQQSQKRFRRGSTIAISGHSSSSSSQTSGGGGGGDGGGSGGNVTGVKLNRFTKTAQLPNGMGVHYVSPPDVQFLYHEIFDEECYLQHGLTLRPEDTVIDVGGNIGMFALFAARR